MPDPDPRSVPGGAECPANCLVVLADALRELALSGQLSPSLSRSASMLARDSGALVVPVPFAATRRGVTETSWYWLSWTRFAALAGTSSGNAIARALTPAPMPDPVAGLDSTASLVTGMPQVPVSLAGTMKPVSVLAALRAELAVCGLSASGLAITRLEGILTLESGTAVRYRKGWLMWPAGRLSRRGRPLQAVHWAGDPAGAARRLARSRIPGGQRPDLADGPSGDFGGPYVSLKRAEPGRQGIGGE